MASLFHSRALSGAYPNRNVTNQSIGVRTNNGTITFRVIVDFGINGKLERFTNIQVAGVRVHTVAEELKAYQKSLTTIVESLEELLTWATHPQRVLEYLDNGPKPTFNKMILEERPLMLHAVRKKGGLSFQMFGEGLNGLEIILDHRVETGERSFVNKINDMIETLKRHVADTRNVKFFDSMDGAVK